MKKRLPALALALALLLGGCATTQSQINTYNATVYVQGVLDETYTGSASDAYMTLMETDKDAVKAAWEKNLEAEYLQRLAVRFEVDDAYVSPQLREDYLDLLRQVYAKVRYTVKAAVALDATRYCVEVTVTPVTFFANAYADGYKNLKKNFDKTHTQPSEEDLKDLTKAQADKLNKKYYGAWAEEVYDYLYDRLDSAASGAAVTKLVLVSPDNQGMYTLSPTDLQDVDDTILLY